MHLQFLTRMLAREREHPGADRKRFFKICDGSARLPLLSRGLRIADHTTLAELYVNEPIRDRFPPLDALERFRDTHPQDDAMVQRTAGISLQNGALLPAVDCSGCHDGTVRGEFLRRSVRVEVGLDHA
ncbi:hypothetical protein AB0C33_20005 [Nonomuraea sp. NPDC048881]|uniref:hypothetical protein n=1 Tax=Nonomuraea sp. NPDC048881 TaxID=3155030 RepID=UPI0033C60D83